VPSIGLAGWEIDVVTEEGDDIGLVFVQNAQQGFNAPTSAPLHSGRRGRNRASGCLEARFDLSEAAFEEWPALVVATGKAPAKKQGRNRS
jgi:hypothetical protein